MATIILLVLFVLMWIVLIVPRQRAMRRHQALVATLAEGDEVISSSGIYGTIREVGADTVQLEVAPGLVVRVAKRAVAAKVPPPATEGALHEAFEGRPGGSDEGRVDDGGTVDDGGAQARAVGQAADGVAGPSAEERPGDGAEASS